MKIRGEIVVTGGAGYVGSVLVPRLLGAGYRVRVLDLFLFGKDVLSECAHDSNLRLVEGDIRDTELLKAVFRGASAVIHLACISNDPSFELDPKLGKSVNFDAFEPMIDIAASCGVRRFIYASSSSVYGIKTEKNVTEDLPLEPLTDYSKYKMLCEDIIRSKNYPSLTTLTVRPATVCGYSPRLRLDLTVNILTNHAVTNRLIKVFGGSQLRPNIHIADMAGFYLKALRWNAEFINGRTYNVGYENHSVSEIAEIVRSEIDPSIEIVTTPSDDLRSYHICSDKVERELGFKPSHTIRDAVRDLKIAFESDRIPNSMSDPRYYNIRTMKELGLSRMLANG